MNNNNGDNYNYSNQNIYDIEGVINSSIQSTLSQQIINDDISDDENERRLVNHLESDNDNDDHIINRKTIQHDAKQLDNHHQDNLLFQNARNDDFEYKRQCDNCKQVPINYIALPCSHNFCINCLIQIYLNPLYCVKGNDNFAELMCQLCSKPTKLDYESQLAIETEIAQSLFPHNDVNNIGDENNNIQQDDIAYTKHDNLVNIVTDVSKQINTDEINHDITKNNKFQFVQNAQDDDNQDHDVSGEEYPVNNNNHNIFNRNPHFENSLQNQLYSSHNTQQIQQQNLPSYSLQQYNKQQQQQQNPQSYEYNIQQYQQKNKFQYQQQQQQNKQQLQQNDKQQLQQQNKQQQNQLNKQFLSQNQEQQNEQQDIYRNKQEELRQNIQSSSLKENSGDIFLKKSKQKEQEINDQAVVLKQQYSQQRYQMPKEEVIHEEESNETLLTNETHKIIQFNNESPYQSLPKSSFQNKQQQSSKNNLINSTSNNNVLTSSLVKVLHFNNQDKSQFSSELKNNNQDNQQVPSSQHLSCDDSKNSIHSNNIISPDSENNNDQNNGQGRINHEYPISNQKNQQSEFSHQDRGIDQYSNKNDTHLKNNNYQADGKSKKDSSDRKSYQDKKSQQDKQSQKEESNNIGNQNQSSNKEDKSSKDEKIKDQKTEVQRNRKIEDSQNIKQDQIKSGSKRSNVSSISMSRESERKRMSQENVLVSLENKQMNALSSNCNEHPLEDGNLFCFTCECKCICLSCLDDSIKHKGHLVQNVMSSYDLLQERLSLTLKEITNKIQVMDSTYNNVSQQKKTTRVKHQEISSQISEMFSGARDALNNKEQELKLAINGHFENTFQLIHQDCNKMQEAKNTLSTLATKLTIISNAQPFQQHQLADSAIAFNYFAECKRILNEIIQKTKIDTEPVKQFHNINFTLTQSIIEQLQLQISQIQFPLPPKDILSPSHNQYLQKQFQFFSHTPSSKSHTPIPTEVSHFNSNSSQNNNNHNQYHLDSNALNLNNNNNQNLVNNNRSNNQNVIINMTKNINQSMMKNKQSDKNDIDNLYRSQQNIKSKNDQNQKEKKSNNIHQFAELTNSLTVSNKSEYNKIDNIVQSTNGLRIQNKSEQQNRNDGVLANTKSIDDILQFKSKLKSQNLYETPTYQQKAFNYLNTFSQSQSQSPPPSDSTAKQTNSTNYHTQSLIQQKLKQNQNLQKQNMYNKQLFSYPHQSYTSQEDNSSTSQRQQTESNQNATQYSSTSSQIKLKPNQNNYSNEYTIDHYYNFIENLKSNNNNNSSSPQINQYPYFLNNGQLQLETPQINIATKNNNTNNINNNNNNNSSNFNIKDNNNNNNYNNNNNNDSNNNNINKNTNANNDSNEQIANEYMNIYPIKQKQLNYQNSRDQTSIKNNQSQQLYGKNGSKYNYQEKKLSKIQQINSKLKTSPQLQDEIDRINNSLYELQANIDLNQILCKTEQSPNREKEEYLGYSERLQKASYKRNNKNQAFQSLSQQSFNNLQKQNISTQNIQKFFKSTQPKFELNIQPQSNSSQSSQQQKQQQQQQQQLINYQSKNIDSKQPLTSSKLSNSVFSYSKKLKEQQQQQTSTEERSKYHQKHLSDYKLNTISLNSDISNMPSSSNLINSKQIYNERELTTSTFFNHSHKISNLIHDTSTSIVQTDNSIIDQLSAFQLDIKNSSIFQKELRKKEIDWLKTKTINIIKKSGEKNFNDDNSNTNLIEKSQQQKQTPINYRSNSNINLSKISITSIANNSLSNNNNNNNNSQLVFSQYHSEGRKSSLSNQRTTTPSAAAAGQQHAPSSPTTNYFNKSTYNSSKQALNQLQQNFSSKRLQKPKSFTSRNLLSMFDKSPTNDFFILNQEKHEQNQIINSFNNQNFIESINQISSTNIKTYNNNNDQI